MRLYVAKRSRVNVMKWYRELLSDGSRGSTYLASPHIRRASSSGTLLRCLAHYSGGTPMIARSAEHGIDQDDITLHFVADQQTDRKSVV